MSSARINPSAATPQPASQPAKPQPVKPRLKRRRSSVSTPLSALSSVEHRQKVLNSIPALRLVLKLGTADTENFSIQSLFSPVRIFYLCFTTPVAVLEMVPELVASDKMLVAAFLSVVCITVVWPLQLTFWYL
ncbi:hypothetical protein TrLO_g4205 [Triparma laevis f. longispina]|uniref:Uncharacterized protein n=1 Tax=Triparma laevis f. longispina TaxID=1714387 RepID=A0A9W7KVS0_9STRA|nr:hypothetical protein TrLO_g4205 [Triparma laevis f. longispina]